MHSNSIGSCWRARQIGLMLFWGGQGGSGIWESPATAAEYYRLLSGPDRVRRLEAATVCARLASTLRILE